MAIVKNISAYGCTWNRLTNTDTGRTLSLEPGEIAETQLPRGFADPRLEILVAKPDGSVNRTGVRHPRTIKKDTPADNTATEIDNSQVASTENADDSAPETSSEASGETAPAGTPAEPTEE